MSEAPDVKAPASQHGPGRVYRFESFQLDADARRLTRDGTEIVLQPRVFDLLLTLLDAPGVLLTRERLLASVWSDTVVADSSLTQSISVLRRELEVGDRRLIRTIPRVGYRFEAAVEVLERQLPVARAAAPAVQAVVEVAAPAPVDAAPVMAPRRVNPGPARGAMAAAALLLALAVGGFAAWRGHGGGSDATPASAQALDAYAKGLALLEQFQPRPARERLQDALQVAPDFAPAHLALAHALAELGARVAALRHSELALAAAAGLTLDDRREAEALSLELKGEWPRACALREMVADAPAAPARATLGLAHCLIRDARAHRASALLELALPGLQGPDRWRALLLDAQAQIAQARYGAAIARAREVAAAAAAMDANPLRARALTVEADAALLSGDLATAARANGEAAALLAALGDVGGAAAAEQKGVALTLMSTDPPRAERMLRGHLAVAERLGDPVLAAHSRRLIASALKAQGELAASRRMLEQALADFIALGDRHWQAKVDVNLALRDQLDGDFASAEARLRDALDAFPARGYERWFAESEMAYTLRHQGRFAEALRAADVAYAAALAEQPESRQLEVRCERGVTLVHLGRTAEAIEELRACRRIAEPEGTLERKPAMSAHAALRLAALAAAAGDAAASRREWEAALPLADQIGDPVVRATVQVETKLVGLDIGVEVDRLRSLRVELPAELAALRLRDALAAAWMQRVSGDPRWADGLDARVAAVHASNWNLRALAMLLQALRDRDAGRADAGAALRTEAARRGDAWVLAQLERQLAAGSRAP